MADQDDNDDEITFTDPQQGPTGHYDFKLGILTLTLTREHLREDTIADEISSTIRWIQDKIRKREYKEGTC